MGQSPVGPRPPPHPCGAQASAGVRRHPRSSGTPSGTQPKKGRIALRHSKHKSLLNMEKLEQRWEPGSNILWGGHDSSERCRPPVAPPRCGSYPPQEILTHPDSDHPRLHLSGEARRAASARVRTSWAGYQTPSAMPGVAGPDGARSTPRQRRTAMPCPANAAASDAAAPTWVKTGADAVAADGRPFAPRLSG